jgi:hypothetical protein
VTNGVVNVTAGSGYDLNATAAAVHWSAPPGSTPLGLSYTNTTDYNGPAA